MHRYILTECYNTLVYIVYLFSNWTFLIGRNVALMISRMATEFASLDILYPDPFENVFPEFLSHFYQVSY